ncbi:MAG: type II toxin-antitoxin system VapC family toxin [bacterium]|nr:type II toxin-antitoxin system VapC family toxin [bacterium]
MPGETKPVDIVLLDSCIVIDFIKDSGNIKSQISKIQNPCINFIVEMELMIGALNKPELSQIRKHLLAFKLLDFHNEIALLSTKLINKYGLSHSIQIADSIIAATSLVYGIPLFTYNTKDFRFIPGLVLYTPDKL